MPTAGTDETATGETATGGAAMSQGSAGSALTDAQVAGITELVNNSEIEQAELAQSKSKNPRVLSFASMMIQHHGDARKKQSALGLSSATSPLSRSLSEEGRQTMATLRDKNGSDFDRAYLQSQVEAHQKVLDTMNRQLLPSVKHQQLKQQLQGMKPTIEQHLEAAREAQRSLTQTP